MTSPIDTANWLARQFRDRANDDPAENTEKDARAVEALRDAVADMVAALDEYAGMLCEHGRDFEGCGKLTPDDCAGCKARALANRIKTGGVA